MANRRQQSADEETWAVVAHSLLNSLAVIKGFADQLILNGERLTLDQRQAAAEVIRDRAAFTLEVVQDLAHGLPGFARELIDLVRMEGFRPAS